MIFSMLTFSISYAAFTSKASNTNNTFTAAAIFPTMTGTTTPTDTPTDTPTPGKIVINEVSPIGTDANDWVELYNSGESSVDVSGWKINDASGSAVQADVFPSVTPIPSHGFAVVVTSSTAVSGIPSNAITITLSTLTIGSNGLATAGDGVILDDNTSTLVDQMSYGNVKTIFNLPAPSGAQTLERFPNGVDTDSASDWKIASSPTLGKANQ